MPSLNVELARPTGIFFIIERLYSRDGLMPSIGEVGPSLTQIHRTVIQLRRKQEMYMDGVKITPKDITLWQQIKYLTGSKITTKDTEGLIYHLEFMGSVVATTPIAGFDNTDTPRFLTSEYVMALPDIMSYGKNPIPDVSLYGKSNVSFFMNDGGKGNPTAIAKYNIKTRELVMINDQAQVFSIMKNIVSKELKK
ncbi:hypothetical protein RJ492_004408 [Pluralibacter gergoviae]|uniref:Uncharacterized protein n=1 Tax=Pluralibacter gergoviae TaxID=61647 RepID=A0AAI9GL85_PLUGE|nr:hypothetical protein [Pluralibacter gergoviae]EKV0917228.1 hypothetical protein [Pluralibacter gergoviae]ELD4297778.1 hypothetical protein [Pluralibacter gergoviae]ELD4308523.1 hypothetical protein [Pluralibacter gergoviae]ELD4333405.1 hypothetical protein [Pluralibacter gergoviae]ELO3508958.1 hypothetical protein [Pluralibacter gergoviae]